MFEDRFVSIKPILRGWSEDKKYCVVSPDGTKYLLRLYAGNFEAKKADFEIMKRLAYMGVPMCLPIELGAWGEGVYTLQSWIEGEDAEAVIPLLSDTQAYVYGLKAGQVLRTIHAIPAPDNCEKWEMRFNRKLDRKIKGYRECPIKFDGADYMIDYISQNRQLLDGRPQTYQHGDYHIGNMMIEQDELKIIDFNRSDFGDPWEEFNRIVWCAQKSPLFASGMVNGYFGGKPPLAFWKLLALYIAGNTLSSVYWAMPFGQEEVDTMLAQVGDVLDWFDNMKNSVPKWYSEGFYIQYPDGVPCKLKEPFDFGFLSEFGRVFKVYDDQDSGNICFGAAKDDKRYFIKFAGAPAERYTGTSEHAVTRLGLAASIYRDLAHPNLIKLLETREAGGGLALVFEWTDGECMGRMYPQSRRKFMSLSLETKIKVFGDILMFHEHAAAQGYVAVDFYDGSIMYDFQLGKTLICDIDYYAKSPYTNTMGRMWGSSRFMSPEEFALGAQLDEITNVYTMGATAFALFSDYDRSGEKWPLGGRAYEVALKAISQNRELRQASISQFKHEWEKSLPDIKKTPSILQEGTLK